MFWKKLSLMLACALMVTTAYAENGDGLVAQYVFENTVEDVSGNGLNGILMGGDPNDPNDRPLFVEAIAGQPEVGMALDFDGVDDYVLVADANAFDVMSQAFTISAWIKLRDEGLSDRRPIVSKELEPDPDGRGWEFKVNNGKLAMQLYSPDPNEGKLTITGATDLPANEWIYVVGIYQADGPEQFYLNGQLEQEQELVTALQANDSPAHIGAYIWSWSGYRRYFAGQIDDLRIHSRAMSEQEIQVRYSAKSEDKLVAQYLFENNVEDLSGNGLNGTLMGGDPNDPNDRPLFVEAVAGQPEVGIALEFDGIDDRVAIADNPAFDAMSETFTITAWIKLSVEGTTDRRPIMSKELEPDTDGRGWEFKVNNSQLAMQLYSPAEGEGKLTITGNASLEAGQWYHVAGIYRADGLEQLYINGQLDHEQELVTALQANDSPGNIGAYIWSPTGYQRYFAGQLDEVWVYSRALPESEVASLAGTN